MSAHRALTSEQESEVVRLLASGTTARSFARRFGVDHKTITKIGGAKRTDLPEAGLGPARDEFERAQMAAYARLRARLNAKGAKAPSDRDLPALTKAMNDTIKAIRLHRMLSKGSAGVEEPGERLADMTIARLQRLAERAPAGPASVEVAAIDDAANGTDGT